MKRIYLAIPYTGMRESSYKQATEATAIIIAGDHDLNVFSPITHSHPLTLVDGVNVPGDWEYWKEVDYQFLDWCDEMWILIPEEGLTKVMSSTGVNAELKIAESMGKPVKFVRRSGEIVRIMEII